MSGGGVSGEVSVGHPQLKFPVGVGGRKPSRALIHLGATVYDLLKWKMIKRRKRIHCWYH